MRSIFSWGQISIAGLVGGLIGALITNWLALYRDRRKEFQDAGKNFREAFLEGHRLLSIHHPMHITGSEFQPTFQLLPKYYKQHYEALIRLEPYLSKSHKQKLRKLWEEYCCFDKTHKCATYDEYKSTENMEEEWPKRELALHRIEKMFKYTR